MQTEWNVWTLWTEWTLLGHFRRLGGLKLTKWTGWTETRKSPKVGWRFESVLGYRIQMNRLAYLSSGSYHLYTMNSEKSRD